MNACDTVKINRSLFNAVLAPLIVATVLGLAGRGWWLNVRHAQQENHLTKHDGGIATLQRDSDRILAKMDEILRELRRSK